MRSRVLVVGLVDKEASQTRDYRVAKNATVRAARPDPSLRKKTLARDDNQIQHYPIFPSILNDLRELGELRPAVHKTLTGLG